MKFSQEFFVCQAIVKSLENGKSRENATERPIYNISAGTRQPQEAYKLYQFRNLQQSFSKASQRALLVCQFRNSLPIS